MSYQFREGIIYWKQNCVLVNGAEFTNMSAEIFYDFLNAKLNILYYNLDSSIEPWPPFKLTHRNEIVNSP